MKSIIEKPWGSYQVLEEGDKYVVKKIIVNPGAKLSLQSHKYRSEHWTVTAGKPKITINKRKFLNILNLINEMMHYINFLSAMLPLEIVVRVIFY